MSNDLIERFLRNNLDDDDYKEYSVALDELCTPKRLWVGLTGEEIINMSCGDLHYAALIGDVVRKLKEKNQ